MIAKQDIIYGLNFLPEKHMKQCKSFPWSLKKLKKKKTGANPRLVCPVGGTGNCLRYLKRNPRVTLHITTFSTAFQIGPAPQELMGLPLDRTGLEWFAGCSSHLTFSGSPEVSAVAKEKE